MGFLPKKKTYGKQSPDLCLPDCRQILEEPGSCFPQAGNVPFPINQCSRRDSWAQHGRDPKLSYSSGLTQPLNYLVSFLSSPSYNINSTLELRHELGLRQALLFADKPGAGLCNAGGLPNFCTPACSWMAVIWLQTSLLLQSHRYRERTQLESGGRGAQT